MYRVKLFVFWLAILSLSACSKYNRILKKGDVDTKLTAAIAYYEKQDYFRASTLLEDLLPLMNGKKNGERVLYYYAYCHYGQRDFGNAAYYFRKFHETYPRSDLAEESYYMYANCLYLDSPVYNLDQTSTFRAIEGILSFVNLFPASSRIQECNTFLDNLRKKLQLKDYNNAKLYHKIKNYKSAVLAIDNYFEDYPNTEYEEELRYLKFDAQYSLAKISTIKRQKERYVEAITFYEDFIDQFPESKKVKTAENMYDTIRDKISKL